MTHTQWNRNDKANAYFIYGIYGLIAFTWGLYAFTAMGGKITRIGSATEKKKKKPTRKRRGLLHFFVGAQCMVEIWIQTLMSKW